MIEGSITPCSERSGDRRSAPPTWSPCRCCLEPAAVDQDDARGANVAHHGSGRGDLDLVARDDVAVDEARDDDGFLRGASAATRPVSPIVTL